MLFSILLALITSNEALDSCIGDDWTAPAGLWGDPHFTTFNQVYEHMQGNINLNGPANEGYGRPKQVEYYLMTNCDSEDTTNPPYRMVGSFARYGGGPMSVLNYIVLELFDDLDGETYYVFLTPGRNVNDMVIPVRKYFKKSDGATVNLRYNNQNNIDKEARLGAGDNVISGKFSINLSGDLDNNFDVILTITSINGICTLRFNMRLGDCPSNQYRWNYITVQPPDCDRCNICGLFGDFRTPLGDSKLLQCDGETYKDYTTNWTPSSIEFEDAGFSYELNNYGQNCEVTDGGGGDEPTVECPTDLLAEIQAEAQVQRDALNICCRNLGGGFCTRLLEGAIDDICILKQADDTICIENKLNEYFTEIVKGECENQGKFGPVPRLLYDFQDGLLEGSEVISNGNPRYDLQSVGNAQIVNGVLKCDGDNDYVYGINNLDFDIGDHSLEVLVSIDDLSKQAGGAIAIDGNYNEANGAYAHDQFDSIVFNEYGDRKTWILGSDYFRRTKDTIGTVIDSSTIETQTGDYLQMIAVYDATNNVAKLYRNGQEELSYTPQGGFMTATADPSGNEGIRMMFCQRHLNAGGSDFPGRIRYGAYYDYALSAEDISILYNTGVVNIEGVAYENVGDELRPNQLLTEGQALVSLNGQFAAAMKADGNFIVYDLNGGTNTDVASLLSTGDTAITPDTSFVVLQASDGNLVIYTGTGGYSAYLGATPVSTVGIDASFLIMQDDGNLVAYATDGSLIAYFDTKGYTSNGPIRVGEAVPTGSAGESDYFGFDSFGDSFKGDTETTTSYMTYLLYLVGLLLITNIICLTIYCLRKKDNKRSYKIVSIDASDAEQVNLK